MFEGKRPQQDSVNDAEDGRVGADASASVGTATAVKPGDLRSIRNA
jgi:hypothetical protein